jgi:thiamine monophosphate kinase
MAYVAVLRGAYDAQIFTNDREKLGAALGHDVSHSSAHAPEMKPEQKQEQAVTPQQEIAQQQEQGEDFDLCFWFTPRCPKARHQGHPQLVLLQTVRDLAHFRNTRRLFERSAMWLYFEKKST